METDGSAVRFSYRQVQKFFCLGARKDRLHFKRGKLLSEELRFGPVVNKFPEVENALAIPKKFESVPKKKEILEPTAEEVTDEKKGKETEDDAEAIAAGMSGLNVSVEEEEAPTQSISHFEMVKRQRKKNKSKNGKQQ